MAVESAQSNRSAESYIGSFISLISKADIRYEGSLFHLNPQESTIGLRDVNSFGTEGRRKDGPEVLPSDKVYEYIFFRGSDIKDLQVLSLPPVQSTAAVPNDPAIIQSHYPNSTSVSSSFLSASAVLATNISSNAQLGLPNSTLLGNLPQNQPVGSLRSWGSFPPPPTVNGNGIVVPNYCPIANGNAIVVPNYCPGQSGSSVGVPHLQQHFLLQSPQGVPAPPLIQQKMKNLTMKTSLSGDASNFAEFSCSPSLTSSVPPSSALPSSVPIRPQAALPSKLSPMLMPNNASNALPTVTLDSNSPLPSPLMASTMDVNPVGHPFMDKPVSVPYQAISQSMPSIVGSSSPVHCEASIPSVLTPGQLLQPGSTGNSSSHLKTAHKETEVVQSSTSKSLPSDSERAMDLARPLPSPFDKKLNGAALHSHHDNRCHTQRRGKKLNGSAIYTHHSERDNAMRKGNWRNGGALCSHRSYRGIAKGRANGLNGAAFHCHESHRGHSLGRKNGPNKAAGCTRPGDGGHVQGRGTQPNKAAVHTRSGDGGHGRGSGTQPNKAAVRTRPGDGGHGQEKGKVSPTVTKFAEDFDFEGMNEKFNKEEIWGHLGKFNKARLEDKEQDENENYANQSEDEDGDGLSKLDVKPVYVKDEFFDSISCNSLNRWSGRGRAKLSERMKIDTETFGEIPRHGCGRSSRNQARGRPRGHGFLGRGRERTVWSRVT